MKHCRITGIILLLCLTLSLIPVQAIAEVVGSLHPLIQPQTVQPVQTEDRYTNILLLGLDHGFSGYWGSQYKKELEECHTDAFMVVSINLTKKEVNLVSIPRDTVTYVPGVHGLYKLDAAINCADSLEQGILRACDAASWILGGISIDYYICLDMDAMIKLGDYIGGIDMELEMSYNGSGDSPMHYSKGFQHLDGQGIMDYARARKNATVNNHDLGRTNRQREVVKAIAAKLRSNSSLIKPAWNYANSGEINFYTNLKLANVLNLANTSMQADSIGSYLLTGPYRDACLYRFTFTEQDNRIKVLKAVWGIQAEELPYVSLECLTWLSNYGFEIVHRINVAMELLSNGRARDDLSDKQLKALNDLEAELNKIIPMFDEAALTLKHKERDNLIEEGKKLMKVGAVANEALNPGSGKLHWSHNSKSWMLSDKYINEYNEINWG